MLGRVKTDKSKQKSVQNFDMESLCMINFNFPITKKLRKKLEKRAARAARKKDEQEKKATVPTEVSSDDRSAPTNEHAAMKMIKIEPEEVRPSTSSGITDGETSKEVGAPLRRMVAFRSPTEKLVPTRVKTEDRSMFTNDPCKSPPAKLIKIEPEEERPSTSSGIRDGVDTFLKMVIFSKGYPIEKLDEDKVQLIKQAILNEVWKSKPSERPQFTQYFYEGGLAHIVCANEISKQWLKNTIPSLTPWQGAILRVCEPKEIKIFKVQVQVPAPVPPEAKGAENILSLFKIQNPSLNVDEWSVIKATAERKRTTLDLYIDEKSLETLSKANYKVNFIFHVLIVKILGRHNIKVEDNSN